MLKDTAKTMQTLAKQYIYIDFFSEKTSKIFQVYLVLGLVIYIYIFVL